MSAELGEFVWYDLMTSDVKGAQAFYSEVIGWGVKPDDDGYTMWTAGEVPLGGVMQLPEEAAKMGAPPHWMAYTAVDDVDAISKKVEQLGGKVMKPGTDIPKVGRFAVLADPQGAVFSVFKGEGDMALGAQEGIGHFSWHELNSSDGEAGWKFYSELFGWTKTGEMDMGPEMGKYLMFGYAGSDVSRGGMSSMAKSMGFPPHWLYYIKVDDLDAAIERAKKHGGKLMNGPMEVPGGDRVAQLTDPQGVMFALHSSK